MKETWNEWKSKCHDRPMIQKEEKTMIWKSKGKKMQRNGKINERENNNDEQQNIGTNWYMHG